jgi:ABC-type antimicrobial peptide transport system permease subunit
VSRHGNRQSDTSMPSTTGNTRPLLRVLLIAVSVVLLIACANVAILMLVRAVRYHREYAVRLALGARSGAILRDTALEGLPLSLSGGLLGLIFAGVAIRIASYLLSEYRARECFGAALYRSQGLVDH